MSTKLEAAKICMNSGCYMAIANGNHSNPLSKLIKMNICTWFLPKVSSLDARKRWIVSSIGSNGKICSNHYGNRLEWSFQFLLCQKTSKD